jgi:hypothetical protein
LAERHLDTREELYLSRRPSTDAPNGSLGFLQQNRHRPDDFCAAEVRPNDIEVVLEVVIEPVLALTARLSSSSSELVATCIRPPASRRSRPSRLHIEHRVVLGKPVLVRHAADPEVAAARPK